MNKPSFQEDHVSQVPALQLLQNLGFTYLRPQEVFLQRKGRLGNVLLEGILAEQLRKRTFSYKGGQYAFTEANVQAAIQALKDVPFDGLVRTSEQIYDLLVLGKAMEQMVAGDTKSFTLNFIDWRRPANNVFHVVEEFEVERTASKDKCRPDVVLFVNGIPLCIIECKQSGKDMVEQAISQNIRNQGDDYIPKLFVFSQLLLAVTANDAAYATTGTASAFWARWRELDDVTKEVHTLINRPLSRVQKDNLFADRFGYVKTYFDDLEAEGREVTEQDRTLYNLCRPERLIELAWRFIVYDAGEKKIARYQQYFTVNSIITRVRKLQPDGRRLGGVVWHTQGSGKSLTMVMLAKSLALEREISNPVIVLVTDRVDLDEQIKKTFHQCGLEPAQAQTGKHLTKLITEGKESVITTVIDKFASAVDAGEFENESPDLFVLVDESHRSVYGETGAKMEKVLPNACFIGFTGTPLMKKEHKTAKKFGGYIEPSYTIDQAVRDKAVVPLLYEGRLVLQQVDQNAIDKWFEVVTKPLSEAQRADLKKKFASADQLNKADRKVYEAAFDISEHYSQNWQGTGFKAQLAAPNKATALKYKKYLDEFGKVTSEVVISAPDTREEQEGVYEVDTEEVRAFWKKMMAKYGTEKQYLEQIINAFKRAPEPEILIVVSKLLTGFDAPKNTVLYLCRSFHEHNLLQAIARVNRLSGGKDFGFIMDYYGVLQKLGEAMDIYSALPEFDEDEISGTVTDVAEEVASLPQKHSELWDVFKTVKGSKDKEKYERLLGDDEVRGQFYDKLNAYHRTLGIALATMQFLRETPEKTIQRYKDDLAFFLKLRVSVKQRYAEQVDYKEYEKRVQKLIDTHVRSEGIQQVTPPVNIFEKDAFKSEVEKLESVASKADTIAHRTVRTITEKMDEDPVFYRRFGKILQDTIDDYKAGRLAEKDYLNKVTEVMESVLSRTGDKLPEILRDRDVAKAFYGVVSETLEGLEFREETEPYGTQNVAANLAVQIDNAVQERLRVDWRSNPDVQNEMRNAIDDLLYEVRSQKGVPLTAQDMDGIIERALEIAKNRYPR
ncbi:type I restriction endonuclease subunit R [Pedosphaera parvula]|uniref:Type I restriction enzyme endonuclease subunit n=1 Tax=Pedosphaera parvula (strain Ellin514) TaxID=320771 RepID=B9XT11_PEDPL|nr:HsdR family type I site-specific deoxyribonuclease [Pedosphaera parvula]EEF57021.1 type I site-specific deoxyribonuclease, HsdR family [Pedosphaera parvula Ellin514]